MVQQFLVTARVEYYSFSLGLIISGPGFTQYGKLTALILKREKLSRANTDCEIWRSKMYAAYVVENRSRECRLVLCHRS